MAQDNPRVQVAVSGAIFRDGKVLLVRRARMPGLGRWSLPGGRVEFGESLHAALHREIAEETGLRTEIVALAGWREALPDTTGGGHYVILPFATRWIAGETVLNEELDAFEWVDPGDLSRFETTSGLGETVQAAGGLIEG